MTAEGRFHSDTRLSDNFTERGLQRLTGQSLPQWGWYVVKELFDNVLEATEPDGGTPSIGLDIELAARRSPYRLRYVLVRDNGSGVSPERVRRVFQDVDRFGGTKRHYPAWETLIASEPVSLLAAFARVPHDETPAHRCMLGGGFPSPLFDSLPICLPGELTN